MSQATIPRFLLPYGRQYLRSSTTFQLLRLNTNTPERHASASSKPRVIAKPSKFNPPSHPSRIRSKPRVYPGPPLSEHQKQELNSKQYPHMMPPEGTFMNWFLRDRFIHVWISMGVLFTLAFYVFVTDFIDKTTFRELLPTKEDWKLHPIKSFKRFWSVYKLHIEQRSAETAERRRQQMEDVQKRKEYRKAHGIEERQLPFGLGVATPEPDAGGLSQSAVDEASPTTSLPPAQEEDDISERRKRPVKKWLGIW